MKTSLGINLKRIRKSRMMTMKELEKISGVTQATISCVETGSVQQVRLGTLKSLADALEVTADDLLK